MGIRINFKQICEKCPHRDTYLDENSLNMNNEIYYIDTIIDCKHAKVCKMYIEWDGPTITEALDR